MLDDSQLIRFFIRFTPRQRQVIHLVCEGMTNRRIGNWLYISPRVVAEHLSNIYAELAVQDELINQFKRQSPNRYTIIRLFHGLVYRHPELDPFDSVVSQ